MGAHAGTDWYVCQPSSILPELRLELWGWDWVPWQEVKNRWGHGKLCVNTAIKHLRMHFSNRSIFYLTGMSFLIFSFPSSSLETCGKFYLYVCLFVCFFFSTNLGRLFNAQHYSSQSFVIQRKKIVHGNIKPVHHGKNNFGKAVIHMLSPGRTRHNLDASCPCR